MNQWNYKQLILGEENRHMLPFHALNYDYMELLNVLSVQKYLKGSL